MRGSLALILLFSLGCPPAKDPVDTAPPPPEDADADGYPADQDCDDGDASVHPGAAEICNGVDDDCDGAIDDSDPDLAGAGTWYADADADGWGDPAAGVQACAQPEGHVADATDCDDGDDSVHPGAEELCDTVDQDCDGDNGRVDDDGDGWALCEGDCDDFDPAVNPAAVEVCDGLDNDCSGAVDEPTAADAATWYADADADGYGDPAATTVACAQPSGFLSDSTDCDDFDPAVSPAAVEVCDGVDNDCSGGVDEPTAADAATWYADADADGYGDAAVTTLACAQPSGFVPDSTDCDDLDPAVNPAAVEVCDGVDNDCSGGVDEPTAADAATWYADADADGYGDAAVTTLACSAPSGFVAGALDCDDRDPAVNLGAAEVCDGLDNDCSGAVDEPTALDASTFYADADADGYGDPAATTVACAAPSGFVPDSTDCDDADPAVNPAAVEVCDGVDNDCSGAADEPTAPDAAVWYADADADGFGDPGAATVACAAPSGFVADSTDCDDGAAGVNPGAIETCDGVDNDCSGAADEPTAADAATWYADADGDGWGDPTAATVACAAPSGFVADATDCDDDDPAVNPAAVEVCDGVDNDCSGAADEPTAADAATWYADADGDGWGDPTAATVACAAPSGFVADSTDCDDTDAGDHPGAAETTGNEDDEDCDGAEVCWDDDDDDGWLDASGDVRASADADCADAREGRNGDPTTDCDDDDAAVHPGAAEVVADEVDQDCDGGEICYDDDDGDGFLDTAGDTRASADADCDDAFEGTPATPTTDCDDADASDHPGATETVANGDDEDCDGGEVCWLDGDDDGWLPASPAVRVSSDPDCADAFEGLSSDPMTDCDDADAAVHPGAAEVVADEVDQDCDGGEVCYDDDDGDGFLDTAGDTRASADADCADAFEGTPATPTTDCDDADAAVYPGATESWYDTVDSDCDGDLDPDPCVDPPPAGSVSVDPTCIYVPTLGAVTPVVEWSMSTFADYPTFKNVMVTPVVGNLTDDNGDGVVDEDDIPDIVVVAYESGTAATLRAISGDGTAVHWTTYGDVAGGYTYYPYRYAGTALGDVDNDGDAEIAATVVRSGTSSCYPALYSDTGDLEWVYTGVAVGCRAHYPALHDLEADGDVEIVFGNLILEHTGTLQGAGTGSAGYYSTYSNSGYHAFGVDMDLDGVMEVVAGGTIYGPAGATLCSTGYGDGYPSVADLDGDGLGEMVVTGNGYIRIFEEDCAYVRGWANGGSGYGGPATLADFDGDGTLEIAVAGSLYYVVYEQSGTLLWRQPVDDSSSHSTGSSVFDFDGDGAAEVVYGDENDLWVYDGATGAVWLQDTTRSSGTVNEYPTIMDVDADGNAEIVVGSNTGAYGVYVLGDAADEWVTARPVWNQQAYYITNVEEDLTIPSPAGSNWPTYNNFRQGSPGNVIAQAATNLYPLAYDVCQEACGDDVDLWVQVANDGLVLADSTLVLAVYGVSSTGALTLLDDTELGLDLDPGDLTAAYGFTFTAAELAPYSDLLVRADADAASSECDEGDNDAFVALSAVCP